MNIFYTKLSSNLPDSTVWAEPYPTRILWITMLSLADQHGDVDCTIPGLARRANITLEETLAGLDTFLAPDEFSRTPDDDGRRIRVIKHGWFIINRNKYRDMQDEEQQSKHAVRQQRYRDKKRVEGVTDRNETSRVTLCDAGDTKVTGDRDISATLTEPSPFSFPSPQSDAEVLASLDQPEEKEKKEEGLLLLPIPLATIPHISTNQPAATPRKRKQPDQVRVSMPRPGMSKAELARLKASPIEPSPVYTSTVDEPWDALDFAMEMFMYGSEPYGSTHLDPKVVGRVVYYHWMVAKKKYWPTRVITEADLLRDLPQMHQQMIQNKPDATVPGGATLVMPVPDPACTLCNGSGFILGVSPAYDMPIYRQATPCSCVKPDLKPWRTWRPDKGDAPS
jgi:hypothetical protein